MNNLKESTLKIPHFSILTGVALLIGYVETLVAMPVFVPGMKLGLGNLVIIIVMYLWGIKSAITISFLKIFLTSLLFSGFGSFMYSFGGAFVSLIIMYSCQRSNIFSIKAVSILGGIGHNIGQLIVASLVIENMNLLYYGLVLLVFGIMAGLVVGIVSEKLLKVLKFTRY